MEELTNFTLFFNNTVDVEREYNKSAWTLLKFTDYARDEEKDLTYCIADYFSHRTY
jgi:hypothetical protein